MKQKKKNDSPKNVNDEDLYENNLKNDLFSKSKLDKNSKIEFTKKKIHRNECCIDDKLLYQIKGAKKYIKRILDCVDNKIKNIEITNPNFINFLIKLENLLIEAKYKNSNKIISIIRKIRKIRNKNLNIESNNTTINNNNNNYLNDINDKDFEDFNFYEENDYYKEDVVSKNDLLIISKNKSNHIINDYLDIKSILESLLKQLEIFSSNEEFI